MKFLLALALITISCSALSKHTIKAFYENEFLDDHISVFLNNGEIVHISTKKKEDVLKIKKAFNKNTPVSFKRKTSNADTADIISAVELTQIDRESQSTSRPRHKEMFTYNRFNNIRFQTKDPFEKNDMTVLSSYQRAQEVMDTFNGDTDKDSQCYNRAHMWSYESLVKRQATLGKVWIFFTRKYIKEFRYKWWFHVAPIAKVDDGNKLYVLDRGFTMIPYNVTNWKNLFIKNEASCPVITDYKDYESKPYEEYCYLIYSSQYYWQPWQLKSLSNKNTHYWGYKTGELRTTYKDALTRWDRHIPQLTNSRPLEDDASDEDTDNENNTSENEIESDLAEETSEVENENTVTNEVHETDHEEVVTSDKDHKRKLQVKEVVYIVRDSTPFKAKIIKIQRDKSYAVRFLDGDYAGQSIKNVWRDEIFIKNACYKKVCTEESYLSLDYNSVLSEVIAINLQGNYLVNFLEGTTKGQRGIVWNKESFAQISGCSEGICINDTVVDTDRNLEVKTVGIHNRKNFVIEFLKGDLKGLRAYSITRSDLAVRKGCHNDLCVGDNIIDTLNNLSAKIIAIQKNGNFVIRYLEGENKDLIQSHWGSGNIATTEGCYDDICIGDEVIDTTNNQRVEIIALSPSNLFSFRFIEGEYKDIIQSGWSSENLAPLEGCYKDICVGDEVINTIHNMTVKVIGYQKSTNYFVTIFTEGEYKGIIQSGLSHENLAIKKGCIKDICVGTELIDINNNVKVEIIAVQTSKNFVIKFLEGEYKGIIQSNWERSNLALLEGCHGDICTGNRVIIPGHNLYAVIRGIQTNGQYVIKFLEGEYKGITVSQYSKDSFGITKGCKFGFCVGDKVYNLEQTSSKVEILAITSEGLFTVQFLDGQYKGQRQSHWSEESLSSL